MYHVALQGDLAICASCPAALHAPGGRSLIRDDYDTMSDTTIGQTQDSIVVAASTLHRRKSPPDNWAAREPYAICVPSGAA